MDRVSDQRTHRLAHHFRRLARGHRTHSEHYAGGRSLAVPEPPIRTGHRSLIEQAGYERVYALDLAHARPELCIVCSVAVACGDRGLRAAGGSAGVFPVALVSATLFCNLDAGNWVRSIPGSRPHSVRTVWPVSLLEAIGAGDLETGASGG